MARNLKTRRKALKARRDKPQQTQPSYDPGSRIRMVGNGRPHH